MWWKMHNDTDDLLRQILAELQGQNGLLRKIAAETIANRQTLQNILQVDQSIDGYVSQIQADLSPKTASITNKFSGVNMANNALVFNVGQTSIDTITPLLADGVTPSGGAVSNVIVTYSDPSATFVVNSDNTVTFTAVAASTGGTPVNGTTQATITDTDGAVATFSQGFTVLVNAVVPPSQLTQSIANVFSTPTP
jgi:hypothetical protein